MPPVSYSFSRQSSEIEGEATCPSTSQSCLAHPTYNCRARQSWLLHWQHRGYQARAWSTRGVGACRQTEDQQKRRTQDPNHSRLRQEPKNRSGRVPPRNDQTTQGTPLRALAVTREPRAIGAVAPPVVMNPAVIEKRGLVRSGTTAENRPRTTGDGSLGAASRMPAIAIGDVKSNPLLWPTIHRTSVFHDWNC